MEDPGRTLIVNVTVEIAESALKAIVDRAKKKAGRDASGHFRVDTHAKVGEMISRFLFEKNFESYVQDDRHNDG